MPGGSSRPLALLLATGLLISASGCSPEPGKSPGPERTGRQIYACDDGSEVAVNFLAGGLTIDLALPEGRRQRLTAPARGLPFVGERVNVYLSNGGIVIARSDGPSQNCRPAMPGRGQAPRPP